MSLHAPSKETQALLFEIARQSICYYLNHHQAPSRDALTALSDLSDPLLDSPCAAFVTLKLNNQLRGCIGSIFASRTLIDEIIHHSINAAFHDHRFRPVNREEYPLLCYEISILSEPYRIDHYDQIDIKKHGVIFEKLGRSALFLPKVATEQGWDLETTLEQLCQKAGLGSNEWQDDAQFSVFEAFEFKENEP